MGAQHCYVITTSIMLFVFRLWSPRPPKKTHRGGDSHPHHSLYLTVAWLLLNRSLSHACGRSTSLSWSPCSATVLERMRASFSVFLYRPSAGELVTMFSHRL